MVNVAQVREVAKSKDSAVAKVYGVLSVTTIMAFFAGYLLSQGFLLYGFVTLLIFISLFILQILLVDVKRFLVAGAVLNAIAVGIPFFKSISLLFFAAFALLLIFLLDAVYRGRRGIQNMMKIRIFRISRVTVGSLITGFVIFLVAVLILSSGFSVEKNRVDQALKIIVAPIGSRYIPDFSPDMKTEELFIGLATSGIAKEKEFQSIPKFEQSLLIDKAVLDLKEGTEEFLGVEIDIDQTVSTNTHEIIQHKLNNLTPTAKFYWSILAIAFVWISVKSVEFLIYIPIALLVFLLYELALATNFAKVQLQSRGQEFISLN